MKDTSIEWCDSSKWGRDIVRKDGYILVHCPLYPGGKSNKGHVLKHRLVLAAYLQRPLESSEHVHHINGVKSDNRVENLMLTTNSEHRKIHEDKMSAGEKLARASRASRISALFTKKPRRMIVCACGCGRDLETPDGKGRNRIFIHGHNGRNKARGRRI